MLVLVIVAVLFLAGSVVLSQLGKATAQTQTQVATDQRDAAGAQAATLASQILAACRSGDLPASMCAQAAQVAAQPIPGEVGPRGETGAAGQPGVAGPVGPTGPGGPAGTTGEPGPAGAAGAQGQNGTDGQSGADGQNGAQGPQGPPGINGHDGSPAQSYTSTFPDGSTQSCTRDGGADTSPNYTCGEVTPPPDGGVLGL